MRKRYILQNGARAVNPDGQAYTMTFSPREFDPKDILNYRAEKVVEGQVQYVFDAKHDFDVACNNLRANGARI